MNGFNEGSMKEDKEFWDWWNSLSAQEKEQEIGK